jgi:hypothetical protein
MGPATCYKNAYSTRKIYGRSDKGEESAEYRD